MRCEKTQDAAHQSRPALWPRRAQGPSLPQRRQDAADVYQPISRPDPAFPGDGSSPLDRGRHLSARAPAHEPQSGSTRRPATPGPASGHGRRAWRSCHAYLRPCSWSACPARGFVGAYANDLSGHGPTRSNRHHIGLQSGVLRSHQRVSRTGRFSDPANTVVFQSCHVAVDAGN